MPDGGFRPGYCPRVTNVGSDMGSSTPVFGDIERRAGELPKVLLADANHAKHDCIEG